MILVRKRREELREVSKKKIERLGRYERKGGIMRREEIE